LEEALVKALTVSITVETGLPAPRPRTWLERMEEPLQHIAVSDAPVLVQGESGVGKEVLARHLHQASPRASRPFLKLNCAALPSELLESELFGYERGAFTGAFRTKPGRFELAEGGTILLDEIGDMDVRLQAKLLQVLQDREFQRLGGRETIRVDVRVVAATHCNLEEAIARQVFREDLFYRLNVINIRIPALRERQNEIVPLARLLLQRHVRPGVTPPEITPSLERVLLNYHWPGNIRELENVMRRFLVFQDGEMIASELAAKAPERRAALPDPCTLEPPPVSWPTSSVLEQVNQVKNKLEADAILLALQSTHWNRKQAAVLLDIDYRALLYKMKKLAIEDKAPAPPVPDCVPESEATDLSPDLSESQRIRSALEATRWNRKQAAALLNVEYRSFLYKIKKLAV
jgi:two-component system response regulator AtoC